MAGGERRGAAANDGLGVGERLDDVVVGRGTDPFEGAEGGSAHAGIRGAEPGTGRCRVASVPGQRRRCAASGRSSSQSFSRFVIVVTITAMAKALTVAMTAPTSEGETAARRAATRVAATGLGE